ncbi:MAG: hypothetical protein U9Q69_01875 [Nanoarchaeota archaeon]|nr:hypothetical protein [Nanoarchaeota archaeon]
MRSYLGKGKRGIVYKVTHKGKPVVLKIENPQSQACQRIKNEAYWLKRLNKYGIGPKFIKFKNNELTREFVKGKEILNWINDNKKNKIKKILKQIFEQCRQMDKLKVNKLEMHKPVKHIIIDKKAIMIDFERCYKTDKPKNITQFVQFLKSAKVKPLLDEKDITFDEKEATKAAKEYKSQQNKKNFMQILASLNL